MNLEISFIRFRFHVLWYLSRRFFVKQAVKKKNKTEILFLIFKKFWFWDRNVEHRRRYRDRTSNSTRATTTQIGDETKDTNKTEIGIGVSLSSSSTFAAATKKTINNNKRKTIFSYVI